MTELSMSHTISVCKQVQRSNYMHYIYFKAPCLVFMDPSKGTLGDRLYTTLTRAMDSLHNDRSFCVEVSNVIGVMMIALTITQIPYFP